MQNQLQWSNIYVFMFHNFTEPFFFVRPYKQSISRSKSETALENPLV